METVEIDTQDLEQMLECPICLERYSEERKAKALPCQHTVCLQCLTVMATDLSFACPECRSRHTVPFQGVEKFPNNLMVMNIMSLQAVVPCKEPGCSERGKFATCFHCKDKLCAPHLKQHSRKVQEDIQGKVGSMRQHVNTYRSQISGIRTLLSDCEEEIARTKAQIISTFDDWIVKLELKKKNLIAGIECHEAEVREFYTSQELDLKRKASCLRDVCEAADDVLSMDIITSVSKVDDLLSRSQALLEQFGNEVVALKTRRFNVDFIHEMSSEINNDLKMGRIIMSVKQIQLELQDEGTSASAKDEFDEYFPQKGKCVKAIIVSAMLGEHLRQWSPFGVAVCPTNGDIVVTSTTEPHVFVLNNNFRFLNSFGKSGCKPGEFNRPSGVVVNTAEEIIACDWYNSRLQVLSKASSVLRIITWQGVMQGPNDVALDDDGCIYVADYESDCVLVFSSNGQPLRRMGSPGTDLGQFSGPYSLAIFGSCIVVSEMAVGHHRLQLAERDGSDLRCIRGDAGVSEPLGVCVDGCGHIMVVDDADRRVKMFDKDDTLCQFTMQGEGRKGDSFIAITSDGQILVTHSSSNSLAVY